ncbi:hypothetical protein [Pacificoceanicola onchidii]|uniref:hypothetical protein n=1 Tax=Pacificoceanicola onchidii TaxID=2562685 RepID=UPI001455EFFA|nr:hypothetical protein [Pacificoceanicola onchidii]
MPSMILRVLSVFLMMSGAAQAQTTEAEPDETTTVSFNLENSIQSPKICSSFIQGAPCKIEVKADSDNCRVRFSQINITFTVTYTGFGRNDRASRAHQWNGDSCNVTTNWPISHEVRGGEVRIDLSYRMTNGQSGTYNKNLSVRGANPAKDAIRGRIGLLTHSIILFQRNALEQFDGSGLPKRGTGFGAGGLENPSAAQLWNWMSNVDAARAPFAQAFADARALPSWMRRGGFPKLPDFTEDQAKRQGLQSLVGESYYKPHQNGTVWREIRGRKPFADKIVKIEAAINAGKPPAGW